MSSVHSSIPPVIDVDAEISYWRAEHDEGRLFADRELSTRSFGHFIPWIKFSCDSLLSHPRASDEERDTRFQEHYALQIMPRLSEEQAREFVDMCWDHIYHSSHHDPATRPRLGAARA